MEHAFVEVRHRRPEARHRIEHVGANFTDGIDGDSRLPHLPDDMLRILVIEADRGDVGDIDGRAVPDRDNDISHIIRAPVFADGANHIASLAFLEIPGAEIPVLLVESLSQLHERDGAGRYLGWIHQHADLPFPTPIDIRRRNALNPFKLRFNHVLNKIPHRLDVDRVAFGRLKNEPGHRGAAGIGTLDDRLIRLEGILLDLVQPVGDLKQRGVNVRAGGEPERDRSPSIRALTGHLLQPLHPFELLLLLINDLALHLLGAGPPPGRRHRDFGFLHVGGELDR